MNPISLATTGYELVSQKARKRGLFDALNLAVPWTEPIGLFAPGSAGAKGGHPSFYVRPMLHIHFLSQWFDAPLHCEFARLDPATSARPPRSMLGDSGIR